MFLASYLTKFGGAIPHDMDGTLLWTTKFDDLDAEDDQIVSRLLEEFVDGYVTADDQLPAFEESAATILQIPIGIANNG